MGSSTVAPPAASPEFLGIFRAHADAAGRMSFDQFMALALYHPDVGYYRQPRVRVGYAPGTDFYTSSTSGPLFGELVSAACAARLRAAGRDPARHTFFEVGAEPDASPFQGIAHPFAALRTVRVGEPIAMSGELVVFSNELFDAQPFERNVYRAGRWRTLGVQLTGDTLVETEWESDASDLPPASCEGYHFDRPLAATRLARAMAAQAWNGLFVAFDYGKTLRALLGETPAGTARAYFQHTLTNDLLARPGHQDLTCHVCWDWLSEALRDHGFAEPVLDFQESFFIRQAGEFIARTSAAEASRLSQRKLALMQLLHPANLGQKFQVLHAIR